jgi:hypothetical protein
VGNGLCLSLRWGSASDADAVAAAVRARAGEIATAAVAPADGAGCQGASAETTPGDAGTATNSSAGGAAAVQTTSPSAVAAAAAAAASATAAEAAWPPHLVLLSDLLYGDSSAAAALVATLQHVCAPHTRVISCNERRFAGDGGARFFALAAAAGFVKLPLPWPPGVDIGDSVQDIELCCLQLLK